MSAFQGLERYDYLLKLIDAWEWGQAKDLAFWLKRRLEFRSVLDIGCASGLYLLPYRRMGCEVFGLDGAPTAGSKLGPGEYERFDLRQTFGPGRWGPRHWDLCLCLETAEHIEPEYEASFLATVSDHCGGLLLWSAAAPGQGGEGHFNLKPKSYWLNQLGAFGFGLHALDGEFQAHIHANRRQTFHPWLINNSLLLSRS